MRVLCFGTTMIVTAAALWVPPLACLSSSLLPSPCTVPGADLMDQHGNESLKTHDSKGNDMEPLDCLGIEPLDCLGTLERTTNDSEKKKKKWGVLREESGGGKDESDPNGRFDEQGSSLWTSMDTIPCNRTDENKEKEGTAIHDSNASFPLASTAMLREEEEEDNEGTSNASSRASATIFQDNDSKDTAVNTTEADQESSFQFLGQLGDATQDNPLSAKREGEVLIFERPLDDSSPKTSISYRKASSSVYDARIIELLCTTFRREIAEDEEWYLEYFRWMLSSEGQEYGETAFVATIPNDHGSNEPEDQQVIGTATAGFVHFDGSEVHRSRPAGAIGYLSLLAVDQEHRRKGIGKNLMKTIDYFAHAHSLESMYLHVFTTNHAAIRLYQRSGYRIVDPDDPIFWDIQEPYKHLMVKDFREPTWLLGK